MGLCGCVQGTLCVCVFVCEQLLFLIHLVFTSLQFAPMHMHKV